MTEQTRAGRPWGWYLIWGGLILALLIAVIAVNSFRGRLGWTADPDTPEDLAARLVPAFEYTFPEGDGPFPAVILMSGCNGVQENLPILAEALADVGWMSVIVDSHGPRGLDEAQLWRLVCIGQILNGAERAADVAVALAELRGRDDVDADRIALLGQSHGGWAVLDFLAFSDADEVPPLLQSWPNALGSPRHEGVVAAAFMYPYCGPAAVGSVEELPLDLSYGFLLVDGDAITNETHCYEIIGRQLANGAEILATVFEGVTHSFDDPDPDTLSTVEFDADATEEATQLTQQFLGQF